MHFDPSVAAPWNGGVGVLLFFIVSGYCIAMTAEKADNISKFWLQRFARLQPALMACIVITLIFVSTLGLPGREVSMIDAVHNALWIPLFSPTPLVDGAYWSLLEEAKFYFVFGLMYYLCRSRILLLFGCFTVIGAVLQIYRIGADHHAAIFPFKGMARPYFFYPYSIFFLMGIAARRSNYGVQTGIFLVAAIAIWKFWGNSLSTVWTILAISIVGIVGVQMRGFRIWRPITFVGLISYPLYLIHQNVGVATIRALQPAVNDPYLRIAIATSIVLILAAFVAWSVEHRFRRAIETFAMRMVAFDPRSHQSIPPEAR
ncbi:acyltransferase [Mesorhizobium sp. PAMC28654]|uniref:acyltransferase family protein n=1 Tax=Mesorhizobium sp. PAMC28654 TaxID=2880934 RepID=UPI001D0B0593|nr:acyltransferase [Mesorhizobium sp. PAMC28654]UDL88314.1 acyltransferase [Mesorhizobium sp. PAMC28654]